MNFTNALLVALLAAHLPPGTAKTGLGLAAIVMISIVGARAIWRNLTVYADAYNDKRKRPRHDF